MNFSLQPTQSKSRRAIRHLLLLGVAFAVGLGCFRSFRFTIPALNYAFSAGVLCIPFLALRPLSAIPRIPKVIGFILVSPLLLVALLSILITFACDLNPLNTGCIQDLQTIRQEGYSVNLVRDGCGGAVGGFILDIEQRRSILPGVYLFRSVDYFDGAYEGKMTSLGANRIRLQVPKGVEGSNWTQEIDRTYTLKPHVYF